MSIRSLIAALGLLVFAAGPVMAGADDAGAGADAEGLDAGYLVDNLRPSVGGMVGGAEDSTFRLKANVVPSGTINVGPVISYSQDRGAFTDRRIDPLAGRAPAWQAGAFVDYRLDDELETSAVVGLNLQLSADTADTRRGWLFLPNVYYTAPVGESWNIRANLSSSYASDDYQGSALDGSSASRRDADGQSGFKDVGIGVGVTYNLTPSWDVDTAVRYQRLLDETASNPDADDKGAANQLFGGVLVRYKF